ncbi:L-type lectin-domain containing receptor kinase IX.1 [Hibiscus syriacus]|uniref:L-type lectin-domain containing receptor kinase IX.1 n=1 Tax=Hibiscus syriacus TaxID=106335 RepID=A0A6A2W948_HIBSY|nr:L-type lectin-domain containing receptor kinase IX.1 [Hibiscus syriacus]
MATGIINLLKFSLLIPFLSTLPFVNSINFQISRFDSNASNIFYQGDAKPSVGAIEFNLDNYINRVGRVTYVEKVPLWESRTQRLADFNTRFSFDISMQSSFYGHGLAFFLAPVGFQVPLNSAGGFLGLFNTTTSDSSQNQIVLVEFDTFENPEWDPTGVGSHVGINENSIASANYTGWNASFHNRDMTDVVIDYNATINNLIVSWSYQMINNPRENCSLSYQIDLMKVLPEWIMVGFSATTGQHVESHTLHSWEFSSSLTVKEETSGNTAINVKIVIGVVVLVVVVIAGTTIVLGMTHKYTGKEDMGWSGVSERSDINCPYKESLVFFRFLYSFRQQLDLLAQQGILKALRPTKPTSMEEEDWEELQQRATRTIRLCLADEVMYHVMHLSSPDKIWRKLESQFMSKSLTTKLYLKQQLYGLKMHGDHDLAQHVNVFNQIVSDLAQLDVKIEDEDRAMIMLCSLPPSYKHMNVGESSQADSLYVNGNRDRGRKPEKARSGKQNFRSKSRDKKTIHCYKCKEAGHMKRDCPKLKKQIDEKRDDSSKSMNVVEDENSDCSEGYMLSISTTQLTDVWILDSRCSYHITPNREWFSIYRSVNSGSVYLGDDRSCNIVGIGDVIIKMYDGSIRTLSGVRHIPNLKKNLISLGTLRKNGFIPKADEDREIIRIVKGALTVMKGKMTAGNIYRLLGSTVVGGVHSVESCDDTIKLWHMRLANLSERGMAELHKRNLLHGVKSCKLDFCKYYVFGKQTKVRFKTTKHTTQGILDYVHSDKSDVFEKFKLWKAEVENQTGRKIKCLRSDNGTEYTDSQFLHLWLPKHFWVEAVNMACYLINRSPRASLAGKVAKEQKKDTTVVDFKQFLVEKTKTYQPTSGGSATDDLQDYSLAKDRVRRTNIKPPNRLGFEDLVSVELIDRQNRPRGGGESVPPMGESVPSEHSGNLGAKPLGGIGTPLGGNQFPLSNLEFLALKWFEIL